MAKDAKGHGSEARGARATIGDRGQISYDPNDPRQVRIIQDAATKAASEARGAHSAGVDQVGKGVPQVSDAAMRVISGTPPGGGFSVTPDGKQPPNSGYMVAQPSRTTPVDAADLTGPRAKDIINSFTAKNADVFRDNPKMHIGGWLDPDTHKMSLDPSEHITDRATAVAAGVARNQKKIWDVKNKVEIDTGGTGE